MSTEGTTHINTSDVVKYLENHIDGNQAFFNISKTMLQLESGNNGSEFTSKIIDSLRAFSANKKRLPKSFNKQNTSKLYVQIKEMGQPISENTAEYLLHLFQANNMLPETIDLCQNYEKMVKGYSSSAES